MAAAVLALVLLVAGCTIRGIRGSAITQPPTTAPPTTTTVGPTTSAAPATTTTVKPPYPVPPTGGCRGPIVEGVLAGASDPRPLVPCGQPHGTETALVLPAPLAGVAERPAERSELPDRVQAVVATACQRGYDAYIGLPPLGTKGRVTSRLVLAWYVPTAEEWALGARWARCDVVVLPVGGEGDTYAGSFAGVLADAQVPVALAACGDGQGLGVRCDALHAFEAVSDGVLPAGDAPPPADAVEAARAAQCDVAAAAAIGVGSMAEQPLLVTRLLAPDRAQWALGDRVGRCVVAAADGRELDDSIRGIGSAPPPLASAAAPPPAG